MGLFKKSLVEVRKVKVGAEVLLMSPPSAFHYREYIRRIKAVYDSEDIKDELSDVNPDTMDAKTAEAVVQNLHRLQDQHERVVLHQIVCCTIGNSPGEKWDDLYQELLENAHKVLFDSVDEVVAEFLQLSDSPSEDEAEKKPDTQTPDLPKD